jgi:hypothetical protein
MAEKESVEKAIKKFKEMAGGDDKLDMKQVLADNTNLEDQIKELKEGLKKKDTEVSTIKKQAKSQVRHELTYALENPRERNWIGLVG